MKKIILNVLIIILILSCDLFESDEHKGFSISDHTNSPDKRSFLPGINYSFTTSFTSYSYSGSYENSVKDIMWYVNGEKSEQTGPEYNFITTVTGEYILEAVYPVDDLLFEKKDDIKAEYSIFVTDQFSYHSSVAIEGLNFTGYYDYLKVRKNGNNIAVQTGEYELYVSKDNGLSFNKITSTYSIDDFYLLESLDYFIVIKNNAYSITAYNESGDFKEIITDEFIGTDPETSKRFSNDIINFYVVQDRIYLFNIEENINTMHIINFNDNNEIVRTSQEVTFRLNFLIIINDINYNLILINTFYDEVTTINQNSTFSTSTYADNLDYCTFSSTMTTKYRTDNCVILYNSEYAEYYVIDQFGWIQEDFPDCSIIYNDSLENISLDQAYNNDGYEIIIKNKVTGLEEYVLLGGKDYIVNPKISGDKLIYFDVKSSTIVILKKES